MAMPRREARNGACKRNLSQEGCQNNQGGVVIGTFIHKEMIRELQEEVENGTHKDIDDAIRSRTKPVHRDRTLAQKPSDEVIQIISEITAWCIGDPNCVYFEDARDAITFAMAIQFLTSRGKEGEMPDEGSSFGSEIRRLIAK